jgi:hypothetical protein
MRLDRRLFLLAVCLLQPGCDFFCYSIQNLVEAPLDAKDECVMRHRFYAMADDAWKQIRQDDPNLTCSIHYAHGFEEGFVAYLDHNGPPEPPGEPPWIYRTSHFETPEGVQTIHDWYAGFRHGAQVAQASGYREAAVIIPIGRRPYQPPVPVAAPEAGSDQGNKPLMDELPAPRTMPPADRGAKPIGAGPEAPLPPQ